MKKYEKNIVPKLLRKPLMPTIILSIVVVVIVSIFTMRPDSDLQSDNRLAGRVAIRFIEVIGEGVDTTVVFELINNSRHYLQFCDGRNWNQVEYFYEGQWRVLARGPMHFMDIMHSIRPNSALEVRLWLSDYLPEGRLYRIRVAVAVPSWRIPFDELRQHDVVAEFYWP